MNQKRIQLSKTSSKIMGVGTIVAIVSAFTFSIRMLELDFPTFLSRAKNAKKVLTRFLAFDTASLPSIFMEMLASLSMALAALFIGFILSICLAFLSASNTAPSRLLASFIKGAVAVVRAVPALVWMLMIVASIGFGNSSGLVGLLFPTCGYLIKSFTATIEDHGTDCIEAIRSTGAGWFGIVMMGVLPGVIPAMISWTSIRLEHNIAESVNLGMVGVSGIGSMLMRAFGSYNYARTTTILTVLFFVMLTTELAITALKQKIIKQEGKT